MLGRKIKSYAEENGIKLSSIANRAGIPQNTFSAIVNGNRRLLAEEYFAICVALGVPVTFFYEPKEKTTSTN